MTTNIESDNRIPVICVDSSAVVGAEIFNPNFWSSASKAVVQSCWNEYSVLYHCIEQITNMCANARHMCEKNIATLQEQWRLEKFDLGKMIFFGQQPDLHIRIEAFFSSVKTLLDLIMQLLSTERIVGIGINGFHREKDEYGGRVLNTLRRNASKDRKDLAAKFETLIFEHKKLWIDQVILSRDLLIHPERGMHQLMFNLELAEKDGTLYCVQVHPPEVSSKPIHIFAQGILKQISAFSSNFLELLRNKNV
jgi:hypothetical protein